MEFRYRVAKKAMEVEFSRPELPLEEEVEFSRPELPLEEEVEFSRPELPLEEEVEFSRPELPLEEGMTDLMDSADAWKPRRKVRRRRWRLTPGMPLLSLGSANRILRRMRPSLRIQRSCRLLKGKVRTK